MTQPLIIATAATLLACATPSPGPQAHGAQMRAAFFDWSLDQGPENWRPRMDTLKAQGYNAIILMGHHFRWSMISRWPQIVRAIARLTEVAHQTGLRIYEHHSAALCSADAIDQPVGENQTVRDLLEIKADTGEPILYMYDAYWLCPNNPTYRRTYLKFVEDIFTAAPLDGFMCDDVEMLPDATVCACQFCRERFRKLSGETIPPVDNKGFWFNEDSALWRQWVRARQTSVADFYAEVNALLKRLRPGAPLFACQADPTGTLVNTQWALCPDVMDPAMDIRFWEDWQGQSPDYRHVWRRAVLNLIYLDTMRGQRKPVLDLFYTRTEPQTFLRWACDRVTGAWTSTTEWSPGPRGAYIGQFMEGPPGPALANIALVYSPASRDFRTSRGHVQSFWAWGEALVDVQASFAALTDDQLDDPAVIARYSLVILPTVVCLSNRAIAALATAAQNGTHIAFTKDGGAFDETGAARTTTALAAALDGSTVTTIAEKPERPVELKRLMRWAKAEPLVAVRGAGRGFTRLFDGGDGRLQLRLMRYQRRPNREWLVGLDGRRIESATLQRTTGEPMALEVKDGKAVIPAGAVEGYCQVHLEAAVECAVPSSDKDGGRV